MTKNNLKVVKSTKDKELEDKEKNKALDAAISQITDSFGKGSVMKLGEQKAMDIESISTGSLSLDLALGIGGLPKGRIVEIYGPESSGKTTLALQVVAEAQKAGGICGFVDAEHALDPVYAKKLGVNTEELLIPQPDTGEQALEITDTLIKSGSISVLVVDSVAALTPKAELEGEMGDHHVGLQARLMSQALSAMDDGNLVKAERELTKLIKKNPDFVEAWNKRATVRFFNGDFSGSETDVFEVLSREPRHFGAISGLAMINVHMGALREAVKACLTVV